MGQCDKSLWLLVVDPDRSFGAELRSLKQVGIEVVFVEPSVLTDIMVPMADRDVAVVCVESAPSLALIAAICKRPDAPPVIAISAAGFEHKSLEHVLLLAEMRGAAAALPKPIEPPELVLAATQAQGRAHRRKLRHAEDLAADIKLGILCG